MQKKYSLFIRYSLLLMLFASPQSHGEGKVFHKYDYPNESLGVSVGEKKYDDMVSDKIFVDGLGREVCFRGWNVSGSTKHVQTGFKPFLSVADAEASFNLLKRVTGANVVRFLIAWEGVNPNPDEISYKYLDDVISQMKCAIRYGMYILIDYHEDLFSRHLFNKDSWFTGNGAPAWVTPNYAREYCEIWNIAGWSGNLFKNEPIRLAFRNFWNNAALRTASRADKKAQYNIQSVFLWQLGEAAEYIKKKLSNDEFAYILGIDPFNEPADGGMEGLSPEKWENQKLWPFYKNVRKTLDGKSVKDKLVFAEPLVFWNTTMSSNKTGGHHFDRTAYFEGRETEKEECFSKSFVFNSHFYDSATMGGFGGGKNSGNYLKNMQEIREEGRYLKLPVFLSEFGMSLGELGSKDTIRIIKGIYQGTEISTQDSKPGKCANFYTPFISSTQWHWDIYCNRHSEKMNLNEQKVLTEKDAWNDENFSVVSIPRKDYKFQTSIPKAEYKLNMDPEVIQRGYPRRIQGHLMNFYYNDLSKDAWNTPLNWACIKIGGKEYFRNQNFMLLTWNGRNSDAPTELFIPKQFTPEQIVLITDKKIYNQTLIKDEQLTGIENEAALISDVPGENDAGSSLIIWDDPLPDTSDENTSVHFALVVMLTDKTKLSQEVAEQIQGELKNIIQVQKANPIYVQ